MLIYGDALQLLPLRKKLLCSRPLPLAGDRVFVQLAEVVRGCSVPRIPHQEDAFALLQQFRLRQKIRKASEAIVDDAVLNKGPEILPRPLALQDPAVPEKTRKMEGWYVQR